jgi:hypothetical protein
MAGLSRLFFGSNVAVLDLVVTVKTGRFPSGPGYMASPLSLKSQPIRVTIPNAQVVAVFA